MLLYNHKSYLYIKLYRSVLDCNHTLIPVLSLYSYHSNLQNKVRPLQAKVASMKSSLSDNVDRLKDMEEKYEVGISCMYKLSWILQKK